MVHLSLIHIYITKTFGLPAVVAVNRFPTDTEAELALVRRSCQAYGANVALSEVWGKGGEGGIELAREVLRLTEQENHFRMTYTDDMPLAEKIRAVAEKVYHADGVDFLPAAAKELEKLEALGFGSLPVCIAKTPVSYTHLDVYKRQPSSRG